MSLTVSARSTCLALAIAAAVSLSIEQVTPAPRDDRKAPPPWSNLPLALARRVHFTTAELPVDPVELDSLRDIRRWPNTMVFDGVRYQLVTHRGTLDIGPVDPSVADPGGYYEAAYAHPKDPRKRMGPAYFWLIDSTLVERGYRTDSWTRSVTYDAKGTLRGFHFWEVRPRPRLSCDLTPHRYGVEEHFGDRGQLVGLQAGGVRYWNGVERTLEDYSEIWQRWSQTLPARGRRSPPKAPSVWDGVPEEIRPLMHVKVAELSQFPAGGESLDDPRRWPATWLVDGQVYRL